MIQKERIKYLNSQKPGTGKFVLYWMQASQRTEYNHALEYAILQANQLNKPVVVFFGLTDDFPEANHRHYYFMLQGLKEVHSSLENRGIRMVIRHRSPEKGVVELSKRACLVVVDRRYLKIQRKWCEYAAKRMNCPLIQVESDVVVPVEEASPKEEFSAATFRPKVRKKLDRYLVRLRQYHPKVDSLGLDFASLDISDLKKAASHLKIDRSVKPTGHFKGGTGEAKRHLRHFIDSKLDHFEECRNDPTVYCLSNMSPYLHFGQVSPLYIALQILKSDSPGKDAYLEELIVRRELSMNFVFYNRNYDWFDGLPEWAKKTLREHAKDWREYVYSSEKLENAKTHDPYWNAAQEEMRLTGKMHGYMRMYWGKKILEWTRTPEEAFQTALHLNNKYELDGRDPNGFTGVAWCFGKHDRPWKERQIFGKVRYMNANGLKRKFDADAYVQKVEDVKTSHYKRPLL
ncbi:MAG: deoxyribodipyrimidine photo-lyase [candidate division Zixibacteria bacterium]|nr:deoxyribodipyrimidine photo-lyase [candidate division Zixibacteria bacterium]